MTPSQSTDTTARRTDPFRWDHDSIARACDHFADPHGPTSQRQFAHDHGIPRSTLGSWLRQPDPDGVDPDLVAFLRSAAGLAFLRRLVLALFLVFCFRGACGLRLLGLFLRLTHLDRLVASSHGALHELGQAIQADLGAFADEERSRLGQEMAAKDIAVVADENFHDEAPCLVAMEPVSNFLLVERYAEHRDAATWTAALQQGLEGLPVTVVLLGSDQAKGLIACAKSGLDAVHLPELFHGQRDLCRPLTGPLQRQKKAAEKELRQAEDLAQYWRDEQAKADAGPPRPGRKTDYEWRLQFSAAQAKCCAEEVAACARRQQEVKDAVRGLADDYHPFDGQTGAPVHAAQLEERLGRRLQTLEQVAHQAELGGQADDTLSKGRRWVVALVAAIGWFWAVVRTKVEDLELAAAAEQAVYEKVLPGLYWRQAARRARTADEGRPQEELAKRLLEEAWGAGGALSRLQREERTEVERVAQEVVGLFARSSSCVEGRNGRLALFHHGQTRLSAARLQALTAVHNYVTERADGTTAAERFFGQKPREAFSWLLERLPDLPRPAAKRPKKAPKTAPKPG
jgi:Family of unknown function (DUF6399)